MSLHIGEILRARSFLYTVVENLGLCIELTYDLRNFINVLNYLQIALCSLGILGSTVAVVVCVKRKMRSSCSVQLACLSLYNIVFLLASLLLAVLGLTDSGGASAAKVLLCLRTLALWGATYSTLDICVQRCVSVALPFLAHRRLTVGQAVKRAVVIVLLGLCFTLPLLLDLIHGYSVGRSCFHHRQLTTFGLVYTLYISLLLLYIVPFSAVIVVNVVLAVLLWRLPQRRVRPKGQAARGEQQLSALVVGLSGWYVVSMLLPSILFLVRLTRLELFRPQLDIRAAAVADTLVVLSCCSNFIFYFLLWRPFRQVVWGWLAGGCRRLRGRATSCHTDFTSSSGNSSQPVSLISVSSEEQRSPNLHTSRTTAV